MSPIRMSKYEGAIRLVLEYHQALSRGDLAGMLRLVSEDCAFEPARPTPAGADCTGKQALARHWEDFLHRQPNARFEIEEIFSLGERCVMRWSISGAGPVPGQAQLRGVEIFRVSEGAIREIYSYIKG